jgi:hypothetical protein
VATALDLRLGITRQDEITCGYDTRSSADIFATQAFAGERLVIHVTECFDRGGTCNRVASCGFDQVVTLSDSEGYLKSAQSPPEGNNCGHRTRTRMGPEELLLDGTHFTRVTDINGIGEGSYSVHIQSVSDPEQAVALRSGDRVVATIDTCGEVHTYSVPVEQGESIQIEMLRGATGSVRPRIEVYDPSGRLVAFPGSGRSEIQVLEPGDHTLLAYSAVAEEGPYDLSVRVVPEPSSGVLALSVVTTLFLMRRSRRTRSSDEELEAA